MKRRPITLTKQEAMTLVNSLAGGSHYVYRGKMLERLIEKLQRRLDEDIHGTAAYEALHRGAK